MENVFLVLIGMSAVGYAAWFVSRIVKGKTPCACGSSGSCKVKKDKTEKSCCR